MRAQIKPAPPGKMLPTPRVADGKPDLTGVYQASTQRGAWQVLNGRASQTGNNERRTKNEPPPYQPWAAAKVKESVDRRGIDDPIGFCLPYGVPRSMMSGPTLYPIQIIQTAKAVLVLFENSNGTFRYIPLDSKHRDDIGPTYNGDSVGHWEGDTLVVDVSNFNDKTWIWGTGTFHTEAMHVVERYTRVDKDQLNYEATIEDPNVFTKPWHLRETFMLREDTLLTEYVCTENNRDGANLQEILKEDPTYSAK